jgi:D-alanine-D-alanine ligase
MERLKLRIAVLYDVWEDEEPSTPPPEKATAARRAPQGPKKKRKKEKLDREEVFEALAKLGHEPFYQVMDGRTQSLTALAKCEAELFFNLTESFAGDDTMDMNIAAYLDLLGKPYTGAGPQALYLAQDKALAKKVFAFHGIRTPFFALSYKGRSDHSHDISFPLIVKPTSEDGSIGIDTGSVVHSVKELMERIHYIHQEFDCPALIEEYIEGREIYAAILGNDPPEVLPLVELDMSRLPKGTPRIAGTEAKWEKESEIYKATRSGIAENLDEPTVKLVSDTALAAYQALKLRDYGRIDLRVTDKGEVYVLEANPNPWLFSGAEFCIAAKKSGRSYVQVIQDIVDLAVTRHGPVWPGTPANARG